MGRARSLAILLALGACARTPQPTPPAPAPVPAPDTAAAHQPPAPPVEVAAPPRHYAPVRLAFVGDINLGTLTLPDGVPPDGGRSLFAAARSALTGDLVVGNFEGVLADSGTSYKCDQTGRAVGGTAPPPEPEPSPSKPRRPARPQLCYAFLTPTHLAGRLVDAGFSHLNLANNHANDFGPEGRASTESVLQGLGLTVYGPTGQVAIDTVRRGDSLTVVGLIGFTTYPFAYDLLDIERSAAVVDSIRPLVDLLVVTFHGGAEGAMAVHTPEAAESLGGEPRGELRRWARAVIDAGADAVVGHGPHVPRGIEFHQGKPIAYSLGNFLTYRGFNLTGPSGLTAVLQLEFDPHRRFVRGRLVPMVQLPLRGPLPDPDAATLDLVRRLSSEDFGPSGARVEPDGTILAP